MGNTSGELGAVVTQASGKARLNGHWLGQPKKPYIELDDNASNYKFPSGSDKVALDLEFNEDAFLSGNIVFGEGNPPPPEAGVSYPPGVVYGIAIYPNLPPVEGFAYELSEASVDFETDAEQVAALSYDHFGPFAEWCPLQPSLVNTDGSFNFVRGDGFSGGLTPEGYVCSASYSDGSQAPIDCNMMVLSMITGGPCACDADGCKQRAEPIQIRLELSGDVLTVTFTGTVVDSGSLGPIKFSRANP